MDVPIDTACFVVQVRGLKLSDDVIPLGNVSPIIQQNAVDDSETCSLCLEYPENEVITFLVRDEFRGIPNCSMFLSSKCHLSANYYIPYNFKLRGGCEILII